MHEVTFESEPGIIIPALAMYDPNFMGARTGVITMLAEGKDAVVHRRDLLELCQGGALVLAMDFRGRGETDGGGMGEFSAVERGINLGRPMMGWRVWDVMRAADYLLDRADTTSDTVAVWGEDEAAMLAIYAAALDERISATVSVEPLTSYAGSKGFVQASWVFPRNILKVADMPDIAGLAAPRALVVANPKDGSGADTDAAALTAGEGATVAADFDEAVAGLLRAIG